MCKQCLLSSLLLISLALAQIVICDLNSPDAHNVNEFNQDHRNVRQVTQDVTGPGSSSPTDTRQQQRLLWTDQKSSIDGEVDNGSDAVDSRDMHNYLYTGRPSVDFKLHILTSPKNCCAGYSKTLLAPQGHHIRLVFLNVYLLPGSEIRISEGDVEKTPNLPPYSRLASESNANVLHISIDEVGSTRDLEWHELPTFMAIYWHVPDSLGVWRRRPYTQCPVAQAAMYGGEVALPASGPVSATDYIYDCIWTIRIPTTGWGVYVRVIEMNMQGHIEIRHGLEANSPLLATNDGNGTTIASLKQPEVGFWGRENGGIYVRVIKPISQGYITFVYGISKLPENNECKFYYRGYFLMQGWNCENPSMCIPLNHTCNGVNNCPYGQDEEHVSCQPSRCKHAYEKQCWSGECVHRLLEFCPEDQCPRDRPFRCDWFHKCYSQIDKCNGIPYCDDGKDERGCPKTSKGLSTKTIVIIVCVSGLFTILPSIILCCWDDPVERDLQRAQEAFTNLCDLYSGRTLITQIQAARRAGTLGVESEARVTNHRPLYPGRSTNQEEVILLGPPEPSETQVNTTPLPTNSLIVPATETSSPRRPPRSLPNLTTGVVSLQNDSSSTSPTRGSLESRESQGSRGSRGSAPPMENSITSPTDANAAAATLSPPPYLLQPDVAALEHPVHPIEDDPDHEPPPYLSPPGGTGATADGLPPDTEAPPPYESVQHVSPSQHPQPLQVQNVQSPQTHNGPMEQIPRSTHAQQLQAAASLQQQPSHQQASHQEPAGLHQATPQPTQAYHSPSPPMHQPTHVHASQSQLHPSLMQSTQPQTVHNLEPTSPPISQPQHLQSQTLQPQSLQAQTLQPLSLKPQSLQPQSLQPQSLQPLPPQTQPIQPPPSQQQGLQPQSSSHQNLQSPALPAQRLQPQSQQTQSSPLPLQQSHGLELPSSSQTLRSSPMQPQTQQSLQSPGGQSPATQGQEAQPVQSQPHDAPSMQPHVAQTSHTLQVQPQDVQSSYQNANKPT